VHKGGCALGLRNGDALQVLTVQCVRCIVLPGHRTLCGLTEEQTMDDCTPLAIIDGLRRALMQQGAPNIPCPIEGEVGPGETVLGIQNQGLRTAYVLGLSYLQEAKKLEEQLSAQVEESTDARNLRESYDRVCLQAEILRDVHVHCVRAYFGEGTGYLAFRKDWQVVSLPKREPLAMFSFGWFSVLSPSQSDASEADSAE
jgi:hypothetical protein